MTYDYINECCFARRGEFSCTYHHTNADLLVLGLLLDGVVQDHVQEDLDEKS